MDVNKINPHKIFMYALKKAFIDEITGEFLQ